MANKTLHYDKINYSFSLLKMLMAFEVLLAHFCNWKEYEDMRFLWPFRELVSLAVPCFMILSFYLTQRSFLLKDNAKFKERLIRLCIPQFGWAVIYYAVYLLLDLFFHAGLHGGISSLFWQIITGHSRYLNATMWFQFDIIVISILFHFIFTVFDEKRGYVTLIVLTLFSYFMQISGINWALFGELEFELKFPLGRIFEMIPYAFLGFTLRYFDILEKMKKYRYILMPLCVVMFFSGFYITLPEFKDFGFSGFIKPYLAFPIIAFAYLTPLEYVPLTIKKAILHITNYSLGIYCIHRLINTLITLIVPELPLRSFERCILLYAICYLACFLIDRIKDRKVNLLIN